MKKELYNYIIGSISPAYNFKEKQHNLNYYIKYMLSRTQSMFTYTGLPDTIPQRNLELLLQVNGCCAFAKVNNNLYAFSGGLGGNPDVYYMPTIFTISNPALNYSANLKIGEECIIIPSDSMYTGLIPLFSKYCTALVENDISMLMATINSRIISLITASDDRTQKAAEMYIKKVVDGELSIVGDNNFMETLKTQPYSNSGMANNITQLIELQQYLKACMYNEIGLQANYNMKRESINSNEAQLNEAALLPLIDDMLRCRQEGLKKVNEMYGTNITVQLNSSWRDLTNNSDRPEAEESEMKDNEVE